jgi:DNA repair protein RecO
MISQIITNGMVLSRTDFQETDRILTILTPKYGKLRVIAKGVRRPRSKLAGGIELFSVNDLTVLPGRGELGTLISSRLKTNYGNIVKDINRTMLGYDLLKRMNRLTEDAAGEEYFDLLINSFEGLDDPDLLIGLLELWFTMQLLSITGHTPNLNSDIVGNKLIADKTYLFDFDAMAFQQFEAGPFTANHIKLLRLARISSGPRKLKQLTDANAHMTEALNLAKNVLQLHVRV